MSDTTLDAPDLPFDRGTRPLDPPAPYGRWREEGPVRRVTISGGRPAWLVTRYDEVRSLLRDPRVSSDATRPGFPSLRERQQSLPGSFISMDPPEHDVLRRMLTRTFMIKNVERLRPAIRRVTEGLLDDLADTPAPADLVEHFALPLPSLVICELFGVPYEDRALFQRNATTLLTLTSSEEEVRAARETLFSYMLGLLAEKDRAPGDDLFSELVVERIRPGLLTREQGAGIGALLLIAGHETTANMLSLSTVALLDHPEQLARMLADPELVPPAVEELLRFLTIVQFGLRRAALADIEVGGTTIREGEGIVLSVQAANRDGRVFDAADSLELDRGDRRHLAFGYGIHQCLGQPLARAELQIALPALFGRFPGLAVAADVAELPFKTDAGVYGLRRLPVTW